MYIPPLYEQTDLDEIDHFLQENTLATLVSNDANGLPLATHIPLVLATNADGKRVLWGHLSKANPQWQNIEQQPSVLAIFLAAHSYISPSWYEAENVPTWDYMSVHVYAKARILAADELRGMMRFTMNHYEHKLPEGLDFDQLSPDLVERDLRGVVGLELDIQRIQSAYKLSQNRNDTDYKNIMHELGKQENTDAKTIANAMSALCADLFDDEELAEAMEEEWEDDADDAMWDD